VQAIAACAGCRWSVPTPDYGIDLTLRRVRRTGAHWGEMGIPLDLQLRSTRSEAPTGEFVPFDLDIRTYDTLRRASLNSPALLLVLVLPHEPDKWLAHSETRLELYHCAYWLSLRGFPRTRNTRSVRVRIPRRNQFSPVELERIMEAIHQRTAP
jgi:Domain of unknown function (DUF4365)